MSAWYVWTVVTNREKKISAFLSGLNIVDDFIYPMAHKEYDTKRGKRIKDVPIYANYIFIKYIRTEKADMIIKNCPWVSNYVGICSENEIKLVRDQNGLNYDKLIEVKELQKDNVVKIIKTPFAGWEAIITSIVDDKLELKIRILGADRIIKCNKDDVELI